MNPEVKALWIEALRSDRFRQGGTYLCRIDDNGVKRHCVLGVLTQLAVEHGICPRERARHIGASCFLFNGSATYLPPEVRLWAGLDTDSPRIPAKAVPAEYRHDDGDDSARTISLVNLNDRGMTFDKLAEVIKLHL